MFKRILVPLDGSPLAEAALPAAASLARALSADLRLVSVLEMPPIFAFPEFRSEDRERAEAYLAGVGGRIGRSLGRSPSVRVREGHVLTEILADAAEWEADLIAMGSHGRSGISRLWIGSIADRCIRRSERPVLLLRAPERADDAPAPLSIRRIVVPLDGSERAQRAIAPASELARALGVPIELVRVVIPVSAPELIPTPFSVESQRKVLEVEKKTAEADLARAVQELDARGLRAIQAVVESMSPARAILERAGDDMVVTTTRGLGGLERVILGSTTDKVTRGARGPVLIVPSEVAKPSA